MVITAVYLLGIAIIRKFVIIDLTLGANTDHMYFILRLLHKYIFNMCRYVCLLIIMPLNFVYSMLPFYTALIFSTFTAMKLMITCPTAVRLQCATDK